MRKWTSSSIRTLHEPSWTFLHHHKTKSDTFFTLVFLVVCRTHRTRCCLYPCLSIVTRTYMYMTHTDTRDTQFNFGLFCNQWLVCLRDIDDHNPSSLISPWLQHSTIPLTSTLPSHLLLLPYITTLLFKSPLSLLWVKLEMLVLWQTCCCWLCQRRIGQVAARIS